MKTMKLSSIAFFLLCGHILFAQQQLIWIDGEGGNKTIYKSDLNGSNKTTVVSSGIDTPEYGIAVDNVNEKVYWTDTRYNSGTDGVWWADLNGTNSNVSQILSYGDIDPSGIAVDPSGGKIYYGFFSGSGLYRANLNGSSPSEIVSTTQYIGAIALDLTNNKVYWTESYSAPNDLIIRANLDGSSPETFLTLNGDTDPLGLAIDPSGGYVYWTENYANTVKKTTITNPSSNVSTLFNSGDGIDYPLDIDIDINNNKIYWVGNDGGVIKYANADGSGSISTVTGTNSNPRALAIFGGGTSAPTTQASNVGFSGTSGTGTSVSWFRGDGDYSAVFMKAASTGTAEPSDGSTYSASPTFGSGTQIGATGWYCVYNGTGTGVSVSGLTEGTTYRVHVCEYNGSSSSELYLSDAGTGNPDNVITLDYPTITTSSATHVASSVAEMGGNASADGGASITGRGVVYSSTDNTPTIGEGGVTQNTNGDGTGTFSESSFSLGANTTYYFQAYAINSVGTSYGGVENFTTGTAVETTFDFSSGTITGDESNQYKQTINGRTLVIESPTEWVQLTDEYTSEDWYSYDVNNSSSNILLGSVIVTDMVLTVRLDNNMPFTLKQFTYITGLGATETVAVTAGSNSEDHVLNYYGDERDGQLITPTTSDNFTNITSFTIEVSEPNGDQESWTFDNFVIETYHEWTGAVSSDWNNDGNWNAARVPTSADNVSITNVAKAPFPVIGINDNAECNNLKAEPNAVLTIESGGSLITTGTITNNGTINIQKNISQEAWHLISIPCTGITSNIFLDDYLQSWDVAAGQWSDIIETTTPLNIKQGYSLWPVASRENSTYTFTGTPLTGNQSISITASGSGESAGMNLVGNPYPSSIDWNELDESYGTVYYWDSQNGHYDTWSGSGSTNGGQQYLPPMQGFFVYTTTPKNFTLTNDCRTHSNATSFYKNTAIASNSIRLQASKGSVSTDMLLIFKEGAQPGFEIATDAWKILSGSQGMPEIYSYENNERLALNVRPMAESIQLGFTTAIADSYSIGISETMDINTAILEDTKLNIFHNLTKGDYRFNWNLTDDETRFKLHLNTTAVDELSSNAVQVYVAASNILIQSEQQAQRIILTDITGRALGVWENTESIPAPQTAGVYLVTAESENQQITKKITIQ